MVIIVHGYDGSGPGHWQRWLQQELERRGTPVAFPDLPDPSAPRKDAWVAVLARLLDAAPSPVVFVCHSLGCWAVDHLLTERGARGVSAAFLVAPPSPSLLFEPVESFLPPPLRAEVWAPLAARSLVVGSDNDDFSFPDEIAQIAGGLGLEHHLIPGAGHVNIASGYGPWPLALEWVEKTIRA